MIHQKNDRICEAKRQSTGSPKGPTSTAKPLTVSDRIRISIALVNAAMPPSMHAISLASHSHGEPEIFQKKNIEFLPQDISKITLSGLIWT